MTKSELTERLFYRAKGLTQADVSEATNTILDAIHDTLTKGGRVEIRGFGVFGLSFRPPRMSRNPKTNEPVSVPGKHMPYFKPGKLLRLAVDQSAPTRGHLE